MNDKLNDNELIQYYIINQELNMSPGKIATQVAHASTEYTMRIHVNEDEKLFNKFIDWYVKGQKKIILRAKQKRIKELEKEFLCIHDFGLTEIPEGSLTCVCLGVMTRKEAREYIKRLQLL